MPVSPVHIARTSLGLIILYKPCCHHIILEYWVPCRATVGLGPMLFLLIFGIIKKLSILQQSVNRLLSLTMRGIIPSIPNKNKAKKSITLGQTQVDPSLSQSRPRPRLVLTPFHVVSFTDLIQPSLRRENSNVSIKTSTAATRHVFSGLYHKIWNERIGWLLLCNR